MNEILIDHDPSIDWHVSIKLANNNKELAKELIDLFIADLPRASEGIQSAFHQKQYHELINQVHRLHGASCYCGVTRLKSILTKMEFSAKEKLYSQFEDSLDEFNNEINNVLTAYKSMEFF